VDLTTDLHSMGQFIQDGSRLMFETVLRLEEPKRDFTLLAQDNDLDGLNYLAGKTMDTVNQCAMQGTMAAHVAGGVPNLIVNVPKQDEFSLGQLFYFFEFGVGVSGYNIGLEYGRQICNATGEIQRLALQDPARKKAVCNVTVLVEDKKPFYDQNVILSGIKDIINREESGVEYAVQRNDGGAEHIHGRADRPSGHRRADPGADAGGNCRRTGAGRKKHRRKLCGPDAGNDGRDDPLCPQHEGRS